MPIKTIAKPVLNDPIEKIESQNQRKKKTIFVKRFDSSVLPTNEILIIVDVATQHKKKQKRTVQTQCIRK